MRKRLEIEPRRIAALFVDLQEEHRQDQRYLVEDFATILKNAVNLQDAARRNGVPVLHAAYIVDADAKQPHNPLTADGTPVFSAKGDPLTEICAEVGPRDGETLVIKTEPSALGSGEMRQRLATLQPEWLMIAGVWTEACIDATVKEAIRLGYRVLLVKDACGSGTAAMHQTGILNLANRLYGGAVVDTRTACRLLGGEAADAWQVEGSVPIRFTFENATEHYAAL